MVYYKEPQPSLSVVESTPKLIKAHKWEQNSNNNNNFTYYFWHTNVVPIIMLDFYKNNSFYSENISEILALSFLFFIIGQYFSSSSYLLKSYK